MSDQGFSPISPGGFCRFLDRHETTKTKPKPEIKSVHRKAVKRKLQLKVSRGGSVSIPKDMAADLGLAKGDTFSVCKTKTETSLE